jgi:hypothetical protein
MYGPPLICKPPLVKNRPRQCIRPLSEANDRFGPRWVAARVRPQKFAGPSIDRFGYQAQDPPVDCSIIEYVPLADVGVHPACLLFSARRGLRYALAMSLPSYRVSRRRTAHAVRASLLASATTTMFGWARASRWVSQRPNRWGRPR